LDLPLLVDRDHVRGGELPAMTKAIDIKRNDDGTWTVFYFGKEAGYIEPIRYSNYDKGYRAVSVHGRLDHTYTLEGAKKFVIENYG
jgi:hypothetical protein